MQNKNILNNWNRQPYEGLPNDNGLKDQTIGGFFLTFFHEHYQIFSTLKIKTKIKEKEYIFLSKRF